MKKLKKLLTKANILFVVDSTNILVAPFFPWGHMTYKEHIHIIPKDSDRTMCRILSGDFGFLLTPISPMIFEEVDKKEFRNAKEVVEFLQENIHDWTEIMLNGIQREKESEGFRNILEQQGIFNRLRTDLNASGLAEYGWKAGFTIDPKTGAGFLEVTKCGFEAKVPVRELFGSCRPWVNINIQMPNNFLTPMGDVLKALGILNTETLSIRKQKLGDV
jgi:hypothetical protein